MGRHESQEALQVCHGVLGGSGLGAGQRAGGGENTAVNTAAVIKQVANGYLQLLLLGGGGGWGRVRGSALRRRRAVDGGMVDGRGCGRLDPVGAKAVKQGVYVAWVGEREGVLGAVVSDRETQKLGRDGVGFDEVETGKARDEIVVIVAILVLDAEIVND